MGARSPRVHATCPAWTPRTSVRIISDQIEVPRNVPLYPRMFPHPVAPRKMRYLLYLVYLRLVREMIGCAQRGASGSHRDNRTLPGKFERLLSPFAIRVQHLDLGTLIR